MPIVRGGQVYGVLTVQNRAARQYDEEEVEALQTVAMVLAEVVAHGALFDVAELDEPELRADRPRGIHAAKVCPKASLSAASCCTSRASRSSA